MKHPVLLLILFFSRIIIVASDQSFNDFDHYGTKITANDILFVEAKNPEYTFLVQFAPYKNTNAALHCRIPYFDPSHYVYSVSVGSSQPLTKDPYVYVAGVVYPRDGSLYDRNGQHGIFIGILINRDPISAQSYVASGQPLPCDHFRIEKQTFLPRFGYQEYFVIAVEPFGRYAIGVATSFVFRYQPFPNTTIRQIYPYQIWPTGSTFRPCAADATEAFTIVAGFVKKSSESRARPKPTIYVVSNSNLTLLCSWTYRAAEGSWQSYLTYPKIETWNKKFAMSVKINGADGTRVLVGMPFLNTVFLFQVSNNGTNLTLASSMSYEKSVGFGKSVTWLSNTQAAILYSAYTPDYLTFYWSKVYVYTWLNDTTLPASPTAVIPNAQQPVPTTMNSNLVRMVSTFNTLCILDQMGGVMLISSESAGFYASTDITISPADAAATMPVMSHAMPCIGGTFKADTGIHPCTPCPVGSRNPGDVGAVACINCSSDAFCPLGAVYEIERASLTSLSQTYPYPRPPDLTVYEDVLINNMVTFGSTGHCRRISPMFWTVILLVLVVLLLLGMASLNLCVEEPRRDRWRSLIKSVLLRTDLVVSDTLQNISPL